MTYFEYTGMREGENERTARGFTLVELIVSVALFMIVVLVSMSAYFSLIALDRKARALNDVVTSLSFAVDSMSRSIRTGTNYNCNGNGNCWGAGNGQLKFYYNDEGGQLITYILRSDNTIGECVGTSNCNSTNSYSITDPRITVSNLKFYVEGTGTTGSDQFKQPRVIFTVTGSITPDARTAPISFTIESAATQRYLDIP